MTKKPWKWLLLLLLLPLLTGCESSHLVIPEGTTEI